MRIFSGDEMKAGTRLWSMRMFRRLSLPASEPQMAVVLAASLVLMGLLLCALLWQSDVISEQREVILSLWDWRYGG